MTAIFANNAFSFLTGDVTPTAQDVTIRQADAGLFPQPDPAKGETFMVTLEDRATNKMEIAECFRRVGPTLSLRRAREGTTPEAFLAGATVSNRLTAGVIQSGLLGWAEFNRRYIGAYATQPTLDPLGFPLQRGAVMYDLNTDSLFVFTTDGWVKWSPSGDLQTGIPPGGTPGDTLTRNAQGLIEWRPTVDTSARDLAQSARDAAAAAQATANSAVTSSAQKVSRGGDTMTGSLMLQPPVDAQGAASPMLVLASAGTGSGVLRHMRAGAPLAEFQFNADGLPYYRTFNAQGQATSRRVLLTGDALTATGTSTIAGRAVFTAASEIFTDGLFTANAGATIRRLLLSPVGTEGGEIVFQPAANGNTLVMDTLPNALRWFRGEDSAVFMNLNLQTGNITFGNNLSANNISTQTDINVGGAIYSRYFRFVETGYDTGIDSSGDGFATMINNGQPTLQTQPGGNVYVWGNITAFSDARMKEDIGIIEDPMALIREMVGVTFIKKGDETRRRQVGFIAQEVEQVLPDLIQRSHDGMMGVNYAAYVSVLNEGLKALDDRLRAVEARHG